VCDIRGDLPHFTEDFFSNLGKSLNSLKSTLIPTQTDLYSQGRQIRGDPRTLLKPSSPQRLPKDPEISRHSVERTGRGKGRNFLPLHLVFTPRFRPFRSPRTTLRLALFLSTDSKVEETVFCWQNLLLRKDSLTPGSTTINPLCHSETKV